MDYSCLEIDVTFVLDTSFIMGQIDKLIFVSPYWQKKYPYLSLSWHGDRGPVQK